MKPFVLSRRTFLRGAGTGLALPVLEAMTDGRGRLFSGRAFAAPPKRLYVMFHTNGAASPCWMPAATGAGYTMMPGFAPLEPFRADLNILSGLGVLEPSVLYGHYNGVTYCTTGRGYDKGGGAIGASLDQALAAELGAGTRFPALTLGSFPASGNGLVNGEVTSRLFDTISWKGAGQAVPSDRDPRALFDRLFAGFAPAGGTPPGDDARKATYDKSVLDRVKADAADLDKRLGAGDRRRLEAHLTSLRELEMRITSSAKPSANCQVPARPAQQPPEDWAKPPADWAKQMVDLYVLAARCDLTHFGSLMLGNGSGTDEGLGRARVLGLPEVTMGHHSLCHANDVVGMGKYTAFQMEFVARFLAGLKDSPDAGGASVLDNSLVYIATEQGDPAKHNCVNFAVATAGKLGGAVKTGRHIAYGNKNLADLLLAMMKLCGSTQTTFGTSSTPLEGLTT
jgi:hypothetical protein